MKIKREEMFSPAAECGGRRYDLVFPDMSGKTGIQRVPSTGGIRSPICPQIFLFHCEMSTHEKQQLRFILHPVV